jgi:predicted flap endonuclease-1-like 5' DNA nuclease
MKGQFHSLTFIFFWRIVMQTTFSSEGGSMHTIRLFQEGGAQGGNGWLVWVVLIIFLLMVLLGWWVSSKGWLKKEQEPAHVEHDHAAQPEAAPVASKSEPVLALVADDLTELEGIGPKVAKVLAGIDISTFEALAKADYAKVKAALDAAGYKYMDPAGWIEQAALAAKGDIEGLKKLQDSLKGGRRVA